MSSFFDNKFISTFILILLVLVTFIVIFTPEILIFKWSANYAVQIMFTFLLLGLLFLGLERKRLMLTSFMCCAALNLFLKSNSNPAIAPPTKMKDTPSFSFAHFNASNVTGESDNLLNGIKSANADVVSIQETTPFWEEVLTQQLDSIYPYQFFNPDLGIFGMSIFSKYPFSHIDTFHYDEIPNISGSIQVGESTLVHFISLHTYPALNHSYYQRLKAHLQLVAERANQLSKPLVILGDYHAVTWSDEIQDFRWQTSLNDSRRGLMPTYPHGSLTFLEQPIDHILYSGDLVCLSFQTISGTNTTHLGISANFQVIPTEEPPADDTATD